ncbi:hypothetical protein DCCM_4425 [Desulfocucumis palustris]|uniref:Uncharacterized protein n=1 Tax=Desulfocucumis palustris TaxID=1898651 RepID=A0A2L2XGN0_9FIRM|nr:hypothetical protein DCCM_4425 [Desulfocucumis palustris]
MVTQIRKTDEINLSAPMARLENICKSCDLLNTEDCKESGCLVGFSKKVLRFALQKGVLDIPGASGLIPSSDFKPYYSDTVAPVLAETCRQCKECRDNHSPDCVVALVRSAMELTVLPEAVPYPGSIFMYLAGIKSRDPQLAAKLADELQKGGKQR